MNIAYLASPYSDPDRSVVLDRVRRVNLAAAHLFARGIFVFASICHTHPIKDCCSFLNGHWEFWEDYDKEMIKRCDQLFVLTLDGWKNSKGVIAEIRYAESISIPIHYISDRTYLITALP